jgi:hypothetical protein
MDRFALLVGASAAFLAAGTASAGRITIVSEDQAAQSWAFAPDKPRIVAGYPGAAADKSRDVCVSIGYLIKPDGSTSDFTQMKAWSSVGGEQAKPEELQAYVQVAAAAVSMWRFVPATPKAHSIYTSASFAFEGSKSLPGDAIRAHCRIDDLAGFVARAKAEKDRRGDINRGRSERMAADNSMVEPMGTQYR